MEMHEPASLTARIDTTQASSTPLQAAGRLAISDTGHGRAILLLHGGGGSATVFGLSQALAAKARVLLPTHPGFDGTPRPPHMNSVVQLARFYLTLLESLGVSDVVVIGSSIGGWIASEMALADASRLKGLVLINAVGIQAPGEALTDVSRLSRPELVRLASHDPDLVLASALPPTPERLAILASNAAALATYDAGAAMMAPGLREKLASVTTPALVLWGESDGIASLAYGQAYAAAFASGKFASISEAGHLPQIEQPARVLEHIDNFIRGLDSAA